MNNRRILPVSMVLSLAVVSAGCSGGIEEAYARIELGRPVPPADVLGMKMMACPYGQGWGQKIQTHMPLSSTVRQLNVLQDGSGNVIGKLREERSTVCLITVVKIQASVSVELDIPADWFAEPPSEVNWQAMAAAANIIDATLRAMTDGSRFAGEVLPPPLRPAPRSAAELFAVVLAELTALPEMDAMRTQYYLPPRPKPEKNIATYIALAVTLLDRMPGQLGANKKTTLRNFSAELDRGPNSFIGATGNQFRADFQTSSGKTFRITRLTERRFAIEVEDVQSCTPTQESLMSISEGE